MTCALWPWVLNWPDVELLAVTNSRRTSRQTGRLCTLRFWDSPTGKTFRRSRRRCLSGLLSLLARFARRKSLLAGTDPSGPHLARLKPYPCVERSIEQGASHRRSWSLTNLARVEKRSPGILRPCQLYLMGVMFSLRGKGSAMGQRDRLQRPDLDVQSAYYGYRALQPSSYLWR